MLKKLAIPLVALLLPAALATAAPPPMTLTKLDPATQKEWLARWDKEITGETKNYRTCDRAVGEDIAWTVTPIISGLYQGYHATHDTKYIDLFIDWTDSLSKRAVKEPDGYPGWPSKAAAGTPVDDLDHYNADSFLSDAMVFTPIVLMSAEINKDPTLKQKYGQKTDGYLALANQLYEKWVKRGGWRETENGGIISVVLPYGLDDANKNWIDFDTRNAPLHGFSHPDNKANLVAAWMLAMYDATGKLEFKDHAEKWFKLMKSRMNLKPDGTYEIWNYWQPAGAWDFKDGGKTVKHWQGVHPNAGYYESDVSDIVNAYEHGIIFTKADIDHLINTAKTSWADGDPGSPVAGMLVSVSSSSGTAKFINAAFPNSKMPEPTSAGANALTGKITSVKWDGKSKKGEIVIQPQNAAAPITISTNKDTKVQVLRMWTALAPYDVEIQKHFEATEQPDGWGGLAQTPYYLSLQNKLSTR